MNTIGVIANVGLKQLSTLFKMFTRLFQSVTHHAHVELCIENADASDFGNRRRHHYAMAPLHTWAKYANCGFLSSSQIPFDITTHINKLK